MLRDNFYIEIQRHNDPNEKNLEKYNLNLSNELNIPIIASHEVYYLENLYEAHDALMCIDLKTISTIKVEPNYQIIIILKIAKNERVIF